VTGRPARCRDCLAAAGSDDDFERKTGRVGVAVRRVGDQRAVRHAASAGAGDSEGQVRILAGFDHRTDQWDPPGPFLAD
jgi:hypothetical protein